MYFTILLMALVFGYAFWMRRKGASALANSKPAFAAFFERTGYRYADMLDAPPDAQADRALADAKKPMTSYEVHYVRDYHGLPVHYSSATGTRKEGNKSVFWLSNQWEADLPRPPRIAVHIADKGLDSALKAAKELFGNSKRVFTPKCRERIQTGISEIDSKFGVWTDDPAGAERMFKTNPALVQLLAGWAELDVSIAGNRAVFADPTQKNMNAAVGGTLGSMAIGFDYSKRLELAVPTHDRVADLFAALVKASA